MPYVHYPLLSHNLATNNSLTGILPKLFIRHNIVTWTSVMTLTIILYGTNTFVILQATCNSVIFFLIITNKSKGIVCTPIVHRPLLHF